MKLVYKEVGIFWSNLGSCGLNLLKTKLAESEMQWVSLVVCLSWESVGTFYFVGT